MKPAVGRADLPGRTTSSIRIRRTLSGILNSAAAFTCRRHVRTSRIVKVGCRLTRIPALARPTARARHLALAGTEQLRRGSDRSEDRAPRCRRVDGEESRVEPEATAAGTGCRPMALTARLAGRSLSAARASGDADGAPQC
jgi:hypothetical protein